MNLILTYLETWQTSFWNFTQIVSLREYRRKKFAPLANFFRWQFYSCKQRWSRGHKARGQGQGHKKNPRPRLRTGMLEARPTTQMPQVESSRTHFEVLGLEGQVPGLGLEASSPRKLACLRLEDSTVFWIVKILWNAWKIFWKTFFCGDRLKNFCELGLESVCPRKGCPWPWPRIFFVSLASSLVSSTPPLVLGLEGTFWSSWPWPRSLKSLASKP